MSLDKMAFAANNGRQTMPSFGPSGALSQFNSYGASEPPTSVVTQTPSDASKAVTTASRPGSRAAGSPTPTPTLSPSEAATETTPVSSATEASNKPTAVVASSAGSSDSPGPSSGATGIRTSAIVSTASTRAPDTISPSSPISSPVPTIITVSPNETPVSVPEDKCSGLSCSRGLAAAIFVPVIIAALVIPLCIWFLYRYRKRHGRKFSRTASRDTEMSESTGSRGRTGGLSAALPMFFGGEPTVPLTFNTNPPPGSRRVDDRDFGRGFVAPAPAGSPSPHSSIAPPRSSSISAPPPYGSQGDSTMLMSGGPVTTFRQADPQLEPTPRNLETHNAAPEPETINPFADPADGNDDDYHSIGSEPLSPVSQPAACSRPRSSRQDSSSGSSVISSIDDNGEIASIGEARVARVSAGVRPVEHVTST